MKMIRFLAVTLIVISSFAFAQLPVVENPDHAAMLASDNPQLAANKKLVYDMWRVLLEAGQYQQAEKFLSDDYTDHNAVIAPGRNAFVEYLKQRPQQTVQNRVQAKITSITAERDIVIINYVRDLENPKEAGKMYTTSGFDMYRIKDGKIVEHWDGIEMGRTSTHIQ